MEVGDYLIPKDLLYTKEHEWARIVNTKAVIGVTDYAAKTLTDVVYVSLPALSSTVRYMEVMGSVESIKAVSDVYSPLTGKVIRINERLRDSPELVNQSPYDDGWLVELETQNISLEIRKLLTSSDYAKHIEGLIEASK